VTPWSLVDPKTPRAIRYHRLMPVVSREFYCATDCVDDSTLSNDFRLCYLKTSSFDRSK
jgi:hypothetical protein